MFLTNPKHDISMLDTTSKLLNNGQCMFDILEYLCYILFMILYPVGYIVCMIVVIMLNLTGKMLFTFIVSLKVLSISALRINNLVHSVSTIPSNSISTSLMK